MGGEHEDIFDNVSVDGRAVVAVTAKASLAVGSGGGNASGDLSADAAPAQKSAARKKEVHANLINEPAFNCISENIDPELRQKLTKTRFRDQKCERGIARA